MSQIRRRRLFVDAKLQGTLLTQVALYWLYCLISVAVLALVWIVIVKSPPTLADLLQELWINCGPALLGSILLLPLVLLDCLRISNRFAGPVLRLRREMKALADGEVSCPVQLREGDFWLEFAEDWNRVLARQTGDDDNALAASTPQPAHSIPPPTVVSRVPTPNSTVSSYTDTISA